MNAVLFAIVFAYVGASDVTAFSQVSGVQQSEKTLILRFEYGDTVEELHWDLAEFTFDPGTSVYLLEVESLDLELVQGLSFQCRYQFSIPAEMGFEYEFTVGDLLPPIMPGSHIDAVGQSSQEAVKFSAYMSPLVVPSRDDYFLERGLEVEYIRSLGDRDGCFARGVHEYPSYEGMVNWWCLQGEGTWHLIIGGLIDMSCNQSNCWISTSWDVRDWPMPDDVTVLRLAQEKYISDMTQHAGQAQMRVAIEGDRKVGDPAISQSTETSCEEGGTVLAADVGE